MTAANRVQVLTVRESTLGTTPTTPRMRTARFTSGDPQFKPTFVDPDEIRSDRMLNDPIKVMSEADVNLGFELSYPHYFTPLADIISRAMFSSWVNTTQHDNDGTADSVITNVAATTNIVTVASGGGSYLVDDIVLLSGFTNSANNGVFVVSAKTGTTVEFSGASFVTEAAPPATARMKVIGHRATSGDVTATSTGLGSTTLDFTTLGLVPGMWIKIGGSTTASKFATAALNSYARVIAVAATALTLDNLPTGWTTDSGTSKLIRIFYGDYVKNGTTMNGMSVEFGYLGQTTPTYVLCAGQVPNTLEFNISSRQKITGSVSFMGMSGTLSTTTQDASPDAATTAVVMAANANVGRMSEGGAKLVMPNCAREFSFQLNNNLRKIECVDDDAPVDMNEGEFSVTGRLNGYYGSDAIYTKFLAGTPTSLSSIVEKNNQVVVFDIPRVTYRSGSPNVTGKNTDVMLALDWQASAETTYFNASLIINRLEYVES